MANPWCEASRLVTSHNGEAGQVLEQALLATARPAWENLFATLKSALLSKKLSGDFASRKQVTASDGLPKRILAMIVVLAIAIQCNAEMKQETRELRSWVFKSGIEPIVLIQCLPINV